MISSWFGLIIHPLNLGNNAAHIHGADNQSGKKGYLRNGTINLLKC
jgi:hypothetical protein